MLILRRCSLFMVLVLSCTHAGRAHLPTAPPLTVSSSDSIQRSLVKLDDHRYQLGTLLIDSERREVTVPGVVNMSRGVVELVACARGGKVHESILVLDVVPYHLQVALLLLGLEPGRGARFQGDSTVPVGSPVDAKVSWTRDDEKVTAWAEDLVWDLSRDTSMERSSWIFTGSRVVDGVFLADVERSLITTYHDPTTILDTPLASGANDEISVVNERLVPPVGTPVVVTLRPGATRP